MGNLADIVAAEAQRFVDDFGEPVVHYARGDVSVATPFEAAVERKRPRVKDNGGFGTEYEYDVSFAVGKVPVDDADSWQYAGNLYGVVMIHPPDAGIQTVTIGRHRSQFTTHETRSRRH